jgi:hypothetical protein
MAVVRRPLVVLLGSGGIGGCHILTVFDLGGNVGAGIFTLGALGLWVLAS